MASRPTPDPETDLIMDPDLAENCWPARLDDLKRSGRPLSLMARTMTRELFETLKTRRTATAGWTIARAINTGVRNPSSTVGCHAGDRETYFDFKALFHPVIEGCHQGFRIGRDRHVSDPDAARIGVELSATARDKVTSTRIRVARNLAGFPLNPGGTRNSREQIFRLLERVTSAFTGDLGGRMLRLADMSARQRGELVARGLLFRGRDRFQAASGHHRHWPHGRGLFLGPSGEFSLWINEGDQIRIVSMERGGDVHRVFDRLVRGIAAIESGVRAQTGAGRAFLEDETLGMITCCPSNLGTAMRAGVHMRIPRLVERHGIGGIDRIAREMGCQARGGGGEHSRVADRVDISNRRRLGLPEWALVADMIGCVNALARMEDAL